MLGFTLSEEHEALRQLAREFAEKEIAPRAAEHDRTGEFPWEVVRKGFEIGLMNVVIPEAYGGPGLGSLEECLITEELAAQCSGIGLCLMINNLASTPVKLAGNEDQKKEFLGMLTREPAIAAYCLTEPAAGSDVSSLTTIAKKDGKKYILNGTKMWITGGGVAKWYTVFAYTQPELRHKGMSAFVVPRDLPGVQPGKKEDMLGQRASNTSEVVFDNVEVPEEYRIGKEGEGFYIAMRTFDHTRPGISAGAVGVARCAMEHAVRYSQERIAFGKPIAELQAIQFMIAEMARDIEAGRLLCWQAAWRVDNGLPNTLETACAKLFCADAAMRITTDAVQIFGGYGYCKEYPVEKLMRDAKIFQIYEGTSQIQKLIIARQIYRR